MRRSKSVHIPTQNNDNEINNSASSSLGLTIPSNIKAATTTRRRGKLSHEIMILCVLILGALAFSFFLLYTSFNIADVSEVDDQVAAKLSSQIKPLKNEIKQLQTSVKDLLKTLENVKDIHVDHGVKKEDESTIQTDIHVEKAAKKSAKKEDATTADVDWQKLNNRTISVFYNTYQNPNSTSSMSYEVIYDQMKRLNSGLLINSTIYYTRFGDLSKWPYTKCTNKGHRQCIEIAASETGDEVITLKYLYDFCKKNTNDRVVYIHSKGTHTRSWGNRILKKVLMKAVQSSECLYQMGTNDMKCNTCSSQLSGLPPHYPGNMWVADCDYISQLIPPTEYGAKKLEVATIMQKATRKLVPENEANDYYITELDDGTTFKFHNGSMWMIYRESWLGVKRYAMEHWLGSHPYFMPCEVFSPKDGLPAFEYGTMKQKKVYADKIDTNLQMSPGLSFKESWHHPYKLHPWFKKLGKLYEYKVLYSKIPPKDSWFYTYFEGVYDY